MSDPLPDAASTPSPASPRAVALGLFILGQLAFLILSSALGFVIWYPSQVSDKPRSLLNRVLPHFAADEQGHGWLWCSELEKNLRLYAQLTGQDQDWCLFAPAINKTTGFPALLLLNEDAVPDELGIPGSMQAFDAKLGHHWLSAWNPPEESSTAAKSIIACAEYLCPFASRTPWEALSWHAMKECLPAPKIMPDGLGSPSYNVILSENEPADVHAYFRWTNSKLRRYEGISYLELLPGETETSAEFAVRVSHHLHDSLKSNHDAVLAYTRWRLKAWHDAHPDQAAPKQVILFQRTWPIHGPGEPRGWDGPYVIPLARWHPDAVRPETEMILQHYDFTHQRFIPLYR